MRCVAIILLVLGACQSIRDAKEIGDAVGSLFVAYHEIAQRERHDAPPNLRSNPGEAGHIAGAASNGEQRHFYAEAIQHTFVFASVDVAGELLEHELVAEYPGSPPHRGGELVVLPRPAILLVDAPPGWSVRAENEDGSYSTTMSGGDGARRFQLSGGRWTVRRENVFLWFDGEAHVVDLEPGEKTTFSLKR